ncbi:hypothetical protein L1987_73020 [Smallanthus sonchifolius]|uniref:Uncharacterized protein n=1 Tax=Smallanthus sonchifolius TaxID=185202 RepID=A0ACB9AX72_9ASTR|nr:hypothetical protein L1987_73020 [Smallanthus sonchifolius]
MEALVPEKKIAGQNGVYDTPPTSMGNSPQSDSGLLKIQTSAVDYGNLSANDFVYSPPESGGLGNSRLKFSYEDLIAATNGFSPQNLLGSGFLADGTQVAVKELKIGGGQGEREFSADLVLDWPTRIKVASGAARGIAYLHEDCHPRIIHRDIKSSNILLDRNFEARVSDFGLAKLAAADMYTHVTTRVMGTFGNGQSVQLRLKAALNLGLGISAGPLLSNAIETEDFKLLVDPRLGTNFVPNEMFSMIEAAAACVRHPAAKRPRMSQVVRAFASLETEDLSNGMRVGESEIYNSAQQDAEIRLFRRMAFGSQNYSTDFFTQTSSLNSNERVKIVVGYQKPMRARAPAESFRLDGCLEEVEEVLEELSTKGEFGFGSFWRGDDGVEVHFPICLVKQQQ